MLALLLAAAATVAPAPPVARKPSTTPPTLTNVQEVFTSDVYPADALRDGIEGVTRVKVSVDARGRPTACAIDSSSGSSILDSTSCRLMMERGKFTPARDRRKRAVAGDMTRVIRWKVETVEAPVELSDFSLKLTYALKDGVPSGACRGESTPAADVARLCEESRPTATDLATDIADKDRASVGELVMIMESRANAPAVPAPLMGIPGMIVLDDRYFQLSVDGAGKVAKCSGGGATLASAGGEALFCAHFQAQKYLPDPKGATRTVLFRSQIYARK